MGTYTWLPSSIVGLSPDAGSTGSVRSTGGESGATGADSREEPEGGWRRAGSGAASGSESTGMALRILSGVQ